MELADLPGVDDANGSYDQSEGSLDISAQNLRGIKTISFWHGTTHDGSLTLDPANPPQGVFINNQGTALRVTAGVIPASWIGRLNAFVQLTNIAGEDANSSTIQTQQ